MNREIKFRVWDILNKRILSYGEIMDLPMWEVFPGTPEQRAFEVMQYTGLKDMNEKEIYEGDIILYNGGLYKIYYAVNHGKYKMRKIKGEGIDNTDFYCLSNMYVVGNTYENQTL